nr:hypothetical protein [Grifola frondosa]
MVDTYIVLSDMVTYLIIIWLFAGKFILRVSPPTVSVVGKIFHYNLIELIKNNTFLFINSQKGILNYFFRLDNKQSADNPLVLSTLFLQMDDTNCEFDFDKQLQLISEDFLISDHLKKHNKPQNDEELGYYLAGLIEGDGYIGDHRVEIAFHMDDISSAYYIKKRIGYGSVLFLKNKNSVRYVLRHKVGLEIIFSLINGKLLGQHKIDQLIKHKYDVKFGKFILPKANFDLLKNHWLAGFADADGSFGIFINKSKTHKTGFNIILTFRIKQKYPELLNLIQKALGGHVYHFNDNMYSYSSTNFKVAYNVVNYFDNFHLLNASKYINYLKWRKAYRIIQRKEHLTLEGLNKIRKLKGYLRD